MEPLSFNPDQPDDEHTHDYRVVWSIWGEPIQRRLFFNRPIQDTWSDLETLAALLSTLNDMGSAATVITYQPMAVA